MTDAGIDLDEYFRRIGYAGGSTPTLETLRGIHAAHPRRIPFENLDPLLGRVVRLDPASLQEKLVRGGRGGYCFEHNLLLSHALRACGFGVSWLAARVVWGRPPDAVGPRSHMLLRVDVGGEPYLADVGFGGLTLTAPLRLKPGVEQTTPHEPFRLTPMGGDYVMEARIRGEWAALYRFDLAEQWLPDYEVTSWYLCTHPDSPFRISLMAARAEEDRRYALRNNEFAVHHLGGGTERRTLAGAAEIRRVLEESFLVTPPDAPELDDALARVVLPAV